MSEESMQADNQAAEAEATAIGWRPKDQFKGDPEKWVDAKTYLERGENVLPIVKATNERLRGDLTRTNVELVSLKEALAGSQKTIEALEKYHQEDIKQKVEAARSKIRDELIAAKKAGDVEAEVDLTASLHKLDRAEEIEVEKRETTTIISDRAGSKGMPRDYTQDPDFKTWREENPQFNTDIAWSAVAHAMANQLRISGDKSIGKEFLDKVTRETNKALKKEPTPSKVEASRGSGNSGGGSSAKTYADLPADAKAACDGYERDLVGPNKLHKTQADWRKRYVEQYFMDI